MLKLKKNNYWILFGIIVISVVARLFGLGFESLSVEQKASVALSVLAGILSVIGLYLLVKELFDDKLAALSSFLLAVSFWHILISKIGAKDIFSSFVLIFAFYFMWHGLKYNHTFDFFVAGLFGGAGFYIGKGDFIAPLIILLVFWNYWDYLKKDFSLLKYEQTKTYLLGGFSLLLLTVIAAILPVIFYIWQNPSFVLSLNNSVLANAEPLNQIYRNLSWIINKILLVDFGNGNLVSWPVSILFAIGFIKELTHWLKRKHGHFSVVHTLLFSWLFVMIIPILLSAREPSILELSVILPPIIILSAKGLWWVIEKLNRWSHDTYPRLHRHYAGLDAGPMLAMLALLISIAILEISKFIPLN